MKPERSFAGPFVALFLAIAVGWLMVPGERPPLRIPTNLAPAPDFALRDLAGRTNRLADFAGKVVVVNFWATYCPPCIRETPAFVALHRAHAADGLAVVGIACDPEPFPVVPDFVRRHGMEYPVLLADLRVVADYGGMPDGAMSLPQTFVVDRRGRLAARYLGRMRGKDLEAVVAPLLAGPAAQGAAADAPPAGR